jgi:CPA2 family monovalent cation:H+ antiporter-2
MPHDLPLIATLAVGLGFAFVGGVVASRLSLPPILGYLIAGIAVGPFTPGFVADAAIARELAELGVMLMMFGVGMHFSLEDLAATRRIAVPGALVQIAVATALGAGLAMWWGWPLAAGIVFGLALSVASTVVLVRALDDQELTDSEVGRIAIGWLIVEDLAMVLALVLLPALAPQASGDLASLGRELVLALGKVAAFLVLVYLGGKRALPWLFQQVLGTRSGELVTLYVVAVAVGVAYGSAQLFDVSFALGAFFAGVVINESDLRQRVARESQPLQNIFVALFFMSVGMLFDPSRLWQDPGRIAAVLAIVLIGKTVAAHLIVRAFGHPAGTARVVAASLAQIGEFSFILVALGLGLGVLPVEAQDLIVAGALLSIALNPLAFRWARRSSL